MLILVQGRSHRAAAAPVIAIRASADGRIAGLSPRDVARFPQAAVDYVKAAAAGKLDTGRTLIVPDGTARVALVLARAAYRDPWNLADLGCALRMLRSLLVLEAGAGPAATVALPTFVSPTTPWPDVRRLMREEFAGYPGDVEIYAAGGTPHPFPTPAQQPPAAGEGVA